MSSSGIKNRTRDSIGAIVAYLMVAIFNFFGLLTSSGNVPQQDWGIPLTATAAWGNYQSIFHVWSYNGFGNMAAGNWGFPFFPILNAVLAPLGFVGGNEIKVIVVSLAVLAGFSMYLFARSLGLRFYAAFLSGLFFMTTAVVFDWLMFGWIFYLTGYALLPLMLLTTKKYLENKDVRYALLGGLILAIVSTMPSFLLVYPLLCLILVFFETQKDLPKKIRGLKFVFISLVIWFLTSLSFFTARNNSATLAFYHGDYFNVISTQFWHFSSLLDLIRLWGSTFNYQFESYFPAQLLAFSFLPPLIAGVCLLILPRNRKVLFGAVAYLFVLVAYMVYLDLNFLVFSLPYGAIFEAPSVFLVPASVGLAIMIGFVSQSGPDLLARFPRLGRKNRVALSFFVMLILIIFSGLPFWTGQTSGVPLDGPATKLNLYEMPVDYQTWSSTVNASDSYFVLYLPMSQNALIANSSYFSQEYQGVSGIFTQTNNLPYVSSYYSSVFLDQLMSNDTANLAQTWGSFSIKFVVVYNNVACKYNTSEILGNLSRQTGLTKALELPNVVVYQDTFVKPVIYSNDTNLTLAIVSHDATNYDVMAHSVEPSQIVFNQAYSENWMLSINGTLLPNTHHSMDNNGFNIWEIDPTGDLNIKIYFASQPIYYLSLLVSATTIVAVIACLILLSIRHYRKQRT